MPMDMGPADPASLLAQNNPPSYSSLGSGGYPGGEAGDTRFRGVSTAPLIPGGGGKSGTETDGARISWYNEFPTAGSRPLNRTAWCSWPTGLIGVAGMIRRRVGSRG